MGIDMVGTLAFGVDLRAKGPDGRTVHQRILAGEFGAYTAEGEEPWAMEEWSLERGLPFDLLFAQDAMNGETTGGVAGRELDRAHNRDTRISQGHTWPELVAFAKETQAILDAHGLGPGSFWLLQSTH